MKDKGDTNLTKAPLVFTLVFTQTKWNCNTVEYQFSQFKKKNKLWNHCLCGSSFWRNKNEPQLDQAIQAILLIQAILKFINSHQIGQRGGYWVVGESGTCWQGEPKGRHPLCRIFQQGGGWSGQPIGQKTQSNGGLGIFGARSPWTSGWSQPSVAC